MGSNITLLDRDLARRSVAEVTGDAIGVTRDIVDEGTRLLGRIEQTVAAAAERRPAHVAVILLLRHVVSMADAVDELFRAGCFQPAVLQVRSILEARMQLLYLLGQRERYQPNPLKQGLGRKRNDVDAVPREGDGTPCADQALRKVQDMRGQAYWIGELRRQRDAAASRDRVAMTEQMEDLTGLAMLPPRLQSAAAQAETEAEIERWNRIVDQIGYASINAEFDQRRRKRFDVEWYALFDGPQSVEGLARSVGMALQYAASYSPASNVMHARDVLGQLGPQHPDGGRAVAPLRNDGAGAWSDVMGFALQMYKFYETALCEVRPEEARLTAEWVARWFDFAGAVSDPRNQP